MTAARPPLIVVAGEALVDLVADQIGGDLARADRFLRTRGGAMANTAAGLARLGARVRFVGQTGHDPMGDWLRDAMADDGIDVRWFLQTSAYKTGLVFVVRDERMVPRYWLYGDPSADMMLTPDEVSDEVVAGADFLHVGTVSMAAPAVRATCFKLMGLARDASIRISFDPNLRLHLWKDHDLLRRLAREAAAMAALVKLNQDELEFMTGERDAETGARRLLELGPEAVVVTRGAAGAYYLGRAGSGEIAGHLVDVVDTMGAGDAFAAGLLAELAGSDWPPSGSALGSAVRFANAAGALVCTRVGALSAITDRAGVEAQLGPGP